MKNGKILKITKKMMVKSLLPVLLTGSLYAEGTGKANPYLSAPVYGVTHFDPGQSDTFPYDVKTGEFKVDLKKYPQVSGGPVNIMTLASVSPDYMWGVSSQGVTYINISDGKFKETARYNVPGVKVVSEKLHEKVLKQKFTSVDQVEKAVKDGYGFNYLRIMSGIYSVVDNENIVYANYDTKDGSFISAVSLADPKKPEKGLKLVKNFDSNKILDGDRVAGMSMTYDGKLIVLGNHSLAVVDRKTGDTQKIIFSKDELITNSVAVDEKNAIYVASDKYMRKVVWTGTKLSEDEKDGAWKSEYNIGEQPPSVKFGKGTGSTPTLMGFGSDRDKLVVITDGEDRMNIVAFWRDEIPVDFKQKAGTKSRRIADQMPITAGQPAASKWIQSEQSVVIKEYGAFVVNNIVDKTPDDRLVGVIALGPVIEPPHGVEKAIWDTKTHSWKSQWVRSDVSSISTVPSLSSSSNIVFVNGYGKDGWEVTGMDWETGKTVHRTIFGYDNFGNGAYSIIQFFPNGDMLFDSIAGPIRVNYK